MFKSIGQFIKILFSPQTFSEEKNHKNNGVGSKIEINLFAFIFISATLVFLQFFASSLSIFHLTFRFLFLASFLVSVVSAYFLLRNKSFILFVSKKSLFVSVFLVCLSTFLFSLRVNWAYWDGSCPTYLTALVTQVANGRFPVSFISFPEFPANYHQGFIYLSGLLSYWAHISSSYAIVIASIAIFFLISFLLQFFFLKTNNRYWYLILPLFVLITSSSFPWFPEFGLYNYLSAFEYVVSNSWPVSLLLIVVLMWFLQNNSQINNKDFLGLTLIILSASTANATVYSVLFLALGGWLLIRLFTYCKNNKFNILIINRTQIKYLLFCFLSLCAAYFLPRYLPSAFLVGPQYDSAHLSVRFSSLSQIGLSLGIVMYYLRLSGIISLVGVSLTLIYIKNSKKVLFQILSLTILFSFIFPIIFKISNVDTWDNIHKFAIINIFLSIILVVVFLSQLTNLKIKKIIWGAIVLSLILSMRADYDIFMYRTSLDFKKQGIVNNDYEDIGTFLKKSYPQEAVLLPFGSNDLCGSSDFGGISAYSGAFVRNNYFKNFLLSDDLEKKYDQNFYWWKNVQAFGDRLKNLKNNEYIIIKNSEVDLFIKQINKFNSSINQDKIKFSSSTIKQFNYFSLYY
jgi:hypothetical protein